MLSLAEADRDPGLCEAIARRVRERRGPSGRHPLAMLVRQRVYRMACGYEDHNDSDALRKAAAARGLSLENVA